MWVLFICHPMGAVRLLVGGAEYCSHRAWDEPHDRGCGGSGLISLVTVGVVCRIKLELRPFLKLCPSGHSSTVGKGEGRYYSLVEVS